MRLVSRCVLSLVLLAAGCATDDALAPLPPTTTTTTTMASLPTPTIDTTVEDPPDPFTPVARSSSSDVVILDAGADDRTRLRYAPTAPAALDNMVTETLTDSPEAVGGAVRAVEIGGTTLPTTDGMRLELDIAKVTITEAGREAVTRSAPPGSVAIEYGGLGGMRILAKPEVEPTLAIDLADALAPILIPLPEEPVGLGAIWVIVTDDYAEVPAPTTYQLTAINGPLITLRIFGQTIGYAGESDSGSQLGVEHSGIITIDTSSGNVRGEIRAVGTAQDFARITLVDGPVTYSLRDPRPHTMRIEHGASYGGADNGSFVVELAGDVQVDDAGMMRFFGTTEVTAETGDEIWPQFDIRVTADGTVPFATPNEIAVLRRFPVRGLPNLRPGSLLHSDVPTEAETPLLIDDIGLGGWGTPLEWTVVDRAGSRFTVEARSTVDQEFFTRGAYNRVVAEISAQWTLDLFDPFTIDGYVSFDGTYWLGEREPALVVETWSITSGAGILTPPLDSAHG
jgi:hypothetical protein